MHRFPVSPVAMFRGAWRNRSLILTLTKREITGRYRGSIMGLLWSLFNPLLMLAVYTFVFSVVFRARWGVGSGSKVEFALVLFAGLIIFNLFAECFNRAPGLILVNANYVKKMVFPLDILPWIILGSALFHTTISICVWLAAYLIFFGIPHASVLLLPIVIVPLGLLCLGMSWALSSLGVYLRDVSQIVSIFTTVLMFLSPIFYPISVLPEFYQKLLYLNPLMPAIEQARGILFFGEGLNWMLMGGYYAAMLGVAWAGFAWFQKTRKGFADVI